MTLNHSFTRVILVAFVSCAGSEHIHAREEDLAGRCWRNLGRRHEQPLRFLCGWVPVSYAGSPTPGHCHPHRVCGLGCCKAAAARRGPALCPTCTPSVLPRQPERNYFLRSIPITCPQLCFPTGDPASGVPREAEQGGERSGSHMGAHSVPARHEHGRGGVIWACQLQDPRAGIPTGLPRSAARDPPGLLLLCILGAGCIHASLRAFTPGAPAQGSTRQDSALETVFSLSSKPQPFLGLVYWHSPMALGLQSPSSGLQSWPRPRKIEEDYLGSRGRREDVRRVSGLWQAAGAEDVAWGCERQCSGPPADSAGCWWAEGTPQALGAGLRRRGACGVSDVLSGHARQARPGQRWLWQGRGTQACQGGGGGS